MHTMVLDISQDKVITAMNREDGLFQIEASSIILAMGCRERSRGALNIPGYRPAGIYSAGTAQKLVNIDGKMPGKEVVILGSGDIGLIMARRMTLEGAKVKVVVELMPYSGGLKRNIVQCLDDFDISLKLSHTVVDIKGKERVEAVVVAKVDEKGKPIQGTEQEYTCDTLLLSVGLLPENELSKQAGIELSTITGGPVVDQALKTSVDGIFACGNVLHVHDLVDYVSQEAALAGRSAANYLLGNVTSKETRTVTVKGSNGVRYTVPSVIYVQQVKEPVTIRFRVGSVKKNCYVSMYLGKERLIHKKRQVVAPGEMESIVITKEQLSRYEEAEEITLCIED